jgi:hypothetical protein
LFVVLVVFTIVWCAWLLQLPLRTSSWLVFASGLPAVAYASWIAKRRPGEPWMRFVARTLDYHALAIVLLFALGVQIEDAHGVTTDGVTYFTQLRSIVFDGDLDVAREFAYLEQPPRPGHVVPIGPIPVWVPLYLMVALADALGRAVGWWAAPADPVAIGLTTPYVRAALLSSFIIGAAGVVAVHSWLRREFSRAPALAATLLLVGGTSLFWYLVYEPSMTHAASFGFTAFFVVAVARCDPRHAAPRALTLRGFLLGLAFITRPQEAVFAILPALQVAALPESAFVRLRVALKYAGWGLVGFAPLLALQLVQSYILFSREHLVLVGDQGFLTPFSSRWDVTLWSSWHGFLSWTPVAYIAIAGTVAYGRRRWWWAAATVLIIFVSAWINGATPDLGAGWSFGGRRFVACLVLLAPGLALIAERLLARPIIAVAMLAAVGVSWNLLLIEQYRTGMLPRDNAVSFAEIIRQQAEVYTRPPYFYPFAFPANAVFAWRTGLPIDRYDLLGAEAPREAIDVELEGSAGRFLLDGWGSPTGDQTGSAWWMASSPATLVLPLRLPDDRSIALTVTARSRLTDPVTRATVAVLVNGHEIGTFVAEAKAPSVATFSSRKDGVWIDGFNRVSFVVREAFWPVSIYRIKVSSQ